ncbi:MAG: ATP-dependent (S)-NAD(P)H-hydrate dehydratase [Sodalis sp.]|nr:MAG: ATP-dependent (S)-NAD(P)H-hydrate dehydratase [Sodalis sp.]
MLVLKGTGTLLVAKDGLIADVGNTGMASGEWDTLSSIIGGLLTQKLSLYDAACAGCVVHSATADRLAARKEGVACLGHRFTAGIVPT